MTEEKDKKTLVPVLLPSGRVIKIPQSNKEKEEEKKKAQKEILDETNKIH